MPLWFTLSVISAVSAGLHVFTQKIGAMHGCNSNILNTYSAGMSALLMLVLAGAIEGFSSLSLLMVIIGIFGGVTYLIGSNIRMDALKYIDATIFFPLHKFLSPLMVLLVSVIFFQEVLALSEWVGISIGLLVPLLLITSSEALRQTHLKKGLVLMCISALFASIAAAINKYGVDLFDSVWLLAAIIQFCSAIYGITTQRLAPSSALTPTVSHTSIFFIGLILASGVTQFVTFSSFLFSLHYNGLLAVVYTIQSLYILIPIVLSILFFKEHWNVQKILAVALSLAAIFLLR